MIAAFDPTLESEVLGTLLIAGSKAFESCRRLLPEMFFLDSHQRVYAVAQKCLEHGIEPDPLAVMEELRVKGELSAVGGASFIAGLQQEGLSFANLSHHAERIAELWKLRRGHEICENFRGRFAVETDAAALLSEMQNEVFDAMQERATVDPLVLYHTTDALNAFLAREEAQESLSYGLPKLDDKTGGMFAGEVTVVGARSGVGKSCFMVQAAALHCKQGTAVDLFSMEMSRENLLHRLWAMESGVPAERIRRKLCNLSEQRCVQEAALRIAEWPLRIHDDSDMTLGEIATMARMSARRAKNPMRLMVVDYAQIVNADGKDALTRVSQVSRRLTKLAKAEKVHLMLLSQLRKPAQNEGYSRPPHVGDLRETGQLENDAHTILLLHRGWDEVSGSISYDAEILMPKQRSGVTGTFQATFNPRNLTFEGVAQ